MSTQLEITVPDIGDFEDVDVVEIFVSVGDSVAVEDPLITLESEKAAMDIPAPQAGTVAAIKVAPGDKVSEGSVIVLIDTEGDAAAPIPESAAQANEPVESPAAPVTDTASASQATIPVTVPDIGDFEDVEVIDILVGPGDAVAAEDSLITLESEKATMDIPAPVGGTIAEVLVELGDRVSEGHAIVTITGAAPAARSNDAPGAAPVEPEPPAAAPSSQEPAAAPPPATAQSSETAPRGAGKTAYASPGVRKFARELGVDLGRVTGSGRKGRVTKPDVKAFVKTNLAAGAASTGSSIAFAPAPPIDFSKFGPVETLELSKVRQLTGQNLHRSWMTAPHVTQFDEADITELEAFRRARLDEAAGRGIKLTLLAFLIKAVVVALKKFPDFNSSLSPDGLSIIRKQYFHIGIAVNTDRGLVVPVLRDADRKGLFDLAQELREVTVKARDRKLAPGDMQGGCFTISSLGGVGGTAFTPIINVPEVAILGISPASMKPVFTDGEFVPRLMLPFALSYDHRVIDGVAGARFSSELGTVLGDIRHILL